MRQSRVILVGALTIAVLCLVAAALGILGMRRGLLRDRPIVLIHNPLRHQQVFLGEGVMVHATARSSSGVSRMELWVDGEAVAADESADGSDSPAVLVTDWQPATLGDHTLVVRAVSRWGVAGQSTVAVVSVSAGVSGATPPDAAVGIGVGDSGEADQAGGGGAGPGAAAGGEAPPPALPSAPGSAQGAVESVDFLRAYRVGEAAGQEITLRMELLSLQSGAAYEGLHCYIGMGGEPPRWLPDQDDDPSTDESFAPLGGQMWDVGAHLAGPEAVLVPWPGDETLPIDINCVGLGNGGLEAYDLGSLALILRPETWDGAIRRDEAAGSEGTFAIEYRITEESGTPHGIPLALDRDMAMPTNLRLDWRSALLLWDFEPLPDQDPIDGFRVLLNGTVQWTEVPEARQSRLPFEWIFPPCGTQYSFTVEAYRGEDWSRSPDPVLVPEGGAIEDCTRTIEISFDTLTTHDLGGDEDYHYHVGPVYGMFYVENERTDFDGRCGYGSGICGTVGLDWDSTYDLHGFLEGLPPAVSEFRLDVDENERIFAGFSIEDHDDWNPNDHVCDGQAEITPALDRLVEGTIMSGDGRCEVSFTARPAFASPVGGIGGAPPRPMLVVEDLTLDEETGQLQIHIRNVGSATAAEQILDVALSWPSGEAIGTYSFPVYLAVGGRTILQSPQMMPGPAPALSACVTLDPNNTILEEDEDDASLARAPFCRNLPDLVITGVNYDSERQGLQITVVNYGEGSLEAQGLEMDLAFADGGSSLQIEWPAIGLEPLVATQLEWPGLGGMRERLLGGYTLTLDPNGRIGEEDPSNNQFTVSIAEPGMYRLTWSNVFLPYYQAQHHMDDNNASGLWATLQTVDRETGRILWIEEWSTGQDEGCWLESDGWSARTGNRALSCHESESTERGLGPNMRIEFRVSGSLGFGGGSGGGALAEYDLGEGHLAIEPDAWASAPTCSQTGTFPLSFEVWVTPETRLMGPPWYTVLYVCRLSD